MKTALMHATPGKEPNFDLGRSLWSSAWWTSETSAMDDVKYHVKISFHELNSS
jgi:hypothetical protein